MERKRSKPIMFDIKIRDKFGQKELNFYNSFEMYLKKKYYSHFRRGNPLKPSEWMKYHIEGIPIHKTYKDILEKYGLEEAKVYQSLFNADKARYRTQSITRGIKPSQLRISRRKKKDRLFYTEFKKVFVRNEIKDYEEMIGFAKKYYRKYFQDNVYRGVKPKPPDEWYIHFVMNSKCVEMLMLEKKVKKLILDFISINDVVWYLDYFDRKMVGGL